MPTLGEVLRNITFGQATRTTPKDPWGQYVRALELLVDACDGWSLLNDEVSPMPSAWIFKIKPLYDLV